MVHLLRDSYGTQCLDIPALVCSNLVLVLGNAMKSPFCLGLLGLSHPTYLAWYGSVWKVTPKIQSLIIMLPCHRFKVVIHFQAQPYSYSISQIYHQYPINIPLVSHVYTINILWMSIYTGPDHVNYTINYMIIDYFTWIIIPYFCVVVQSPVKLHRSPSIWLVSYLCIFFSGWLMFTTVVTFCLFTSAGSP